ncbi:hypothetical protein [Variovorax sp. YR216]|uniref:hypothetical protein n=1 Tax=Variovorax sp. YR216 TaxID=1882828 RepID=UPI0008949427|nr:hypothetical protein [Variovorax sp. YR216]SEB24416.1 hypothetical protein SAMN05444680_12059 [Variovorax sp. YR216]
MSNRRVSEAHWVKVIPIIMNHPNHLPPSHQILNAARDASGGDIARAMRWYRTEPIIPLEYKTAERLVAEGRANDVLLAMSSSGVGLTR